MNPSSRLALGTVQLGMPYGIANRAGQPSRAEAFAVLDAAWAGGITCFDTASAYGDSEALLGEWASAHGVRPRFVTKLAKLPPAVAAEGIADCYRGEIGASLARLKSEAVWGLLLHDPADYVKHPGPVAHALKGLLAAGRMRHAGASVYVPGQLGAMLPEKALTLFQVPLNAFNAGFAQAGGPGRLLLARSCFLQGLFFLPPEEAEMKVPGSGAPLRRLLDIAARRKLSMRRLALGYALSFPGFEAVVVGVETPQQLRENLEAAADGPLEASAVEEIRAACAGLPDAVTDPSRWGKP